ALKAEADEANKAKSQFLANMSHEIRTPINAVLGMDEIILRETKEISTREYAKIIDNAGKTLLSLINDILDLSKIEAGKMELICADYDIYAMLTDLIVMARFQADEKALELKLKISDKLPKILYGDEKRVRQIITNIITNAIKYTDVGFVSIEIKCKKESDDSVTLVVSVRDTGIGIKEADMKKLFGSFERIENETTHKTEGTGLGISISTQLLELMNGQMKVDSTFGEGSKFTLYIPQKVGDEAAFLESKKHIVRTGTFTAPDAELLIVDDNAANLAVATMLLSNTKIKCETVMSGDAFLEAIAKKRYDLIFLDYRMPGMDGVEAFKRFREGGHLCEGVPVIMMTAEAENGAEESFIKLGMNDYLSKPIIPALYESLIKKYLPPEKVIPVKQD
ncbi:MAG: response regulator, partial [Lachnospiraceae bacterium]|nr:response regulator [Lachnospiraceae bacterium]